MKLIKRYLCILIVLVLAMSSCNVPGTASNETSKGFEITTPVEQSTEDEVPTVEITDAKELRPIRLDENGEYSIICDNSEIFRSSAMYVNYDVKKNKVDKKTVNVQLGEKIFENALYSYVQKEATGEIYDIYITSDKTTEIIMVRGFNEYRFFGNYEIDLDGGLIEFPEEQVTEDSLYNFVLPHLLAVVGDIDRNEYTYYIKTGMTGADEDWRTFINTEKEGFHTENVLNYEIGFAKYIAGVRTEDKICAILGKNGDLRAIHFNNYNVDWSECQIDVEKAEAKAKDFIENGINDEYELVSYEIVNKGISRIFDRIGFKFAAAVEYYPKDNPSLIEKTKVSFYLG